MSKYKAYITIGLARILGGMSLLVFMIYLFVDSLNLFDMRLDESGILWFDAGLSLLFFIQHSGMIRKPFRRWLARFIPEEYARRHLHDCIRNRVVVSNSAMADVNPDNH